MIWHDTRVDAGAARGPSPDLTAALQHVQQRVDEAVMLVNEIRRARSVAEARPFTARLHAVVWELTSGAETSRRPDVLTVQGGLRGVRDQLVIWSLLAGV